MLDDTADNGPRRVANGLLMQAFSGCVLQICSCVSPSRGRLILAHHTTFLTTPGHVSGSWDSSLARNAPVMLSAPVSRSTNSECGFPFHWIVSSTHSVNAGLQAPGHSEGGADLTHNRACTLAARHEEDLLLEAIKALQVIWRVLRCLTMHIVWREKEGGTLLFR